MNIGFDLDKIFINYPPFMPDIIIDKLYKKKDNGILIYRIPNKPEQFIRKMSHFTWLRPPIKKNVNFLKSISKKKNKLYLISSRFGFLEKQTQKITKKHGLDEIFDEMFFNFKNDQPHLFKNAVIKKLKLDMYIDDDLSLLKHVANENKKTKFFWLTNSKENKSKTKNIITISDLSQIFSE